MPTSTIAVPFNDYATTAYDFGAAGVAPLYKILSGGESAEVGKRARVHFKAGTKTGAGNISAYLAELLIDPITGARTYAAVGQTVGVALNSGGALATRRGSDGSNVNIPVGQHLDGAIPVAIVAGDHFVLTTNQPVLGPLFLVLTASNTATLVFSASTQVDQWTGVC